MPGIKNKIFFICSIIIIFSIISAIIFNKEDMNSSSDKKNTVVEKKENLPDNDGCNCEGNAGNKDSKQKTSLIIWKHLAKILNSVGMEVQIEKKSPIDEINSLAQKICDEEGLPNYVWISPKLMMEKDYKTQKETLEKLLQYCNAADETDMNHEKKQHLELKIKLLKEKIDMIKYYNDLFYGYIEMADKKMATSEVYKDSLKEEGDSVNVVYYNVIDNNEKMKRSLEQAIKKYKSELKEL